jgi:hypothetical protein
MANGTMQHELGSPKGRQFRSYNIVVILAMSFGSIAMGYSGSIIGSTLAQHSFYEYFQLRTRPDATGLL